MSDLGPKLTDHFPLFLECIIKSNGNHINLGPDDLGTNASPDCFTYIIFVSNYMA